MTPLSVCRVIHAGVTRALADLNGSTEIRPDDVLEAIQFRSLDRKLFT